MVHGKTIKMCFICRYYQPKAPFAAAMNYEPSTMNKKFHLQLL